MKRPPTHPEPRTADSAHRDSERSTDEILADLLGSDRILAPDDDRQQAAEIADLRQVIDRVREVRPQPRVEPDWGRMAATIGRACDEVSEQPSGWNAALRRWLETWLQPRYALAAAGCAVAIIALVLVTRGDDPPPIADVPTPPGPEESLVLDLTGDESDETSWPLLDDELALLDSIDDSDLDELSVGLAAELTTEEADDPGDEDSDGEPTAVAANHLLAPELAMEWADLESDLDDLVTADLDDDTLDDLDDQELDLWLDGLSETELDELDAALAG